MGYHQNEETTKQAIKDSQRFLNDRARYKHALEMCLESMGIDQEDRTAIIENCRNADFDLLEAYLMISV